LAGFGVARVGQHGFIGSKHLPGAVELFEVMFERLPVADSQKTHQKQNYHCRQQK
jgi:hypothetical protein